MYIIDKLQEEALIYMEKRKKIEEKRRKLMVALALKMQKDIESKIKSAGNISITFLSSYVLNELKPIVDDYTDEQNTYVDNFIRDDYKVGFNTGHNFLMLTKEDIAPVNNELNDNINEEVLLSLLLFGKQIIDNIHSDLLNNLNRDMTSIYIENKNLNNYNAEKEVETDSNKTVNTILTGSIISKYISHSFKNTTIRLDLTARNENVRALNHGLLMRYLLAKRSDLPELKVKWQEVRDEKLCKYCREAAAGGEYGDGIYDMRNLTPPPLHSRCRCIIIPYEDKWAEKEI